MEKNNLKVKGLKRGAKKKGLSLISKYFTKISGAKLCEKTFADEKSFALVRLLKDAGNPAISIFIKEEILKLEGLAHNKKLSEIIKIITKYRVSWNDLVNEVKKDIDWKRRIDEALGIIFIGDLNDKEKIYNELLSLLVSYLEKKGKKFIKKGLVFQKEVFHDSTESTASDCEFWGFSESKDNIETIIDEYFDKENFEIEKKRKECTCIISSKIFSDRERKQPPRMINQKVS